MPHIFKKIKRKRKNGKMLGGSSYLLPAVFLLLDYPCVNRQEAKGYYSTYVWSAVVVTHQKLPMGFLKKD